MNWFAFNPKSTEEKSEILEDFQERFGIELDANALEEKYGPVVFVKIQVYSAAIRWCNPYNYLPFFETVTREDIDKTLGEARNGFTVRLDYKMLLEDYGPAVFFCLWEGLHVYKIEDLVKTPFDFREAFCGDLNVPNLLHNALTLCEPGNHEDYNRSITRGPASSLYNARDHIKNLWENIDYTTLFNQHATTNIERLSLAYALYDGCNLFSYQGFEEFIKVCVEANDLLSLGVLWEVDRDVFEEIGEDYFSDRNVHFQEIREAF